MFFYKKLQTQFAEKVCVKITFPCTLFLKPDASQIDEYEKEGKKVKYIRGTDIYTPFLVGPDAGYLISNVV